MEDRRVVLCLTLAALLVSSGFEASPAKAAQDERCSALFEQGAAALAEEQYAKVLRASERPNAAKNGAWPRQTRGWCGTLKTGAVSSSSASALLRPLAWGRVRQLTRKVNRK